jgi:hypothetical protein
MRAAFVLALLGVVGCSSESGVPILGGGRSCTLIGCMNLAKLTVTVATTREQLLATTIELCRNGQCSRATPTEVPDSAGSGAGGPLVGPLRGTFTVWGASAGRFKLDVEAHGEGPYPYGLTDGDKYTLTLTHSSGAKVAETSATVTYRESYPNGKECDQYACRQASHDGGEFTATIPTDAGAD